MALRLAHRRLSTLLRGGLAVLAAAGFALLTRPLFPPDHVLESVFHPAVLAGGFWASQLWFATRASASQSVLGSAVELLGVANAVTLVRGGLYAVVAGFVAVPAGTSIAWVPAVCYGTGAAMDWLDGTIARTLGTETRVGTRLDVAFDTFGFVAAPLVAVLWGQLPVWYLSLSALRYVYRAGLAYRRRRGRQVYRRPDSDLGRYLAGLQMVFLTVALVPAAPEALVRAAAPFVLAPSVAVFCRDFLVATGRVGLRRTDSGN